MAYDYIRRRYGRNFAELMSVKHTVTGRDGIVKREDKSQSHYVMVRFAGDKHRVPCHPEELEIIP